MITNSLMLPGTINIVYVGSIRALNAKGWLLELMRVLSQPSSDNQIIFRLVLEKKGVLHFVG